MLAPTLAKGELVILDNLGSHKGKSARNATSLSASIRFCRSMTASMLFKPTIPHFTRSSLHRCLQRHGISRLPGRGGWQAVYKRKFANYPIGSFHIDIAEVRTAMGKLYLFVAIDRTSKFAFTELHEKATIECRVRLPART